MREKLHEQELINFQFKLKTVNQLLFLIITLIRDLPKMKWFAATNFRNQALSTPVFFITTIWQIQVRSEKYSRQ